MSLGKFGSVQMNNVAILLREAAERSPDAVALEDSGGEVTYGELYGRSREIAADILSFNRREPIAVYLPKSIDAVAVFYGALMAGVPYAPIDYGAPCERVLSTLRNLEPQIVVTDDEGLRKLNGSGFEAALVSRMGGADGDQVDRAMGAVIDTDPAYIMYTSGSTGAPKGVTIPHRGVIDYAQWVADTFHIGGDSVLGMQSGLHFDNSVFDIYAGACGGAKVVMVPDILFRYPEQNLQYVRDKGVTCIFWVPTVMITTAYSGALDRVELPALRTVVFAGEVMPNKALNVWRRALPGRTFANLYGPTEITVDCTCYIVDRDFADGDDLPIGYERPNMRVYILREDGSEAAADEAGELCVSGSQLALGYWNNPVETGKAFVRNPLNRDYEEIIYRTGDMARRDSSGLIYYIGRRDNQIKLRGNRIELGDIEAAARRIEGVDNACAVFDRRREMTVLFLETRRPFKLRAFNMELGRFLPRYMLPGELRCMERLPLNQNNKIARRELRELLEVDNGDNDPRGDD